MASMTIKKRHDGALIISDIAKGYLVEKVYMGYSKKAAVSLFISYLKTL